MHSYGQYWMVGTASNASKPSVIAGTETDLLVLRITLAAIDEDVQMLIPRFHNLQQNILSSKTLQEALGDLSALLLFLHRVDSSFQLAPLPPTSEAMRQHPYRNLWSCIHGKGISSGISRTIQSSKRLAWIIIPQPWSWELFDGYIVYSSWRVYVLVCAMPSLLAAFLMTFFLESPKFLMAIGRNEQAIDVLRSVYRINTGRDAQTYPELYLHLCGGRMGKHLEKTPLSTPNWNSNPNLPVLESLVYCESDALDPMAT
uniref:Uncharacterized protein n=1 Tax=Timema shepardi TaxID=629360 RepID=A0A7R9B0E9_TIMSH|nr:unnamed protein product [Timema shepardi]